VKVLLTEDVPKLGSAGDIKNVADGYARNYLFPRGYAVAATPGVVKDFELQREAEGRRERRLASKAESLAKRLSQVTLVFEAKAGETGHLYGSITNASIAEALEAEVGEKFDRRKILSDPIREIGWHKVSIRLRSDIVGEFKVAVKPEGGDLPEEPPDEPELEVDDAEARAIEAAEELAVEVEESLAESNGGEAA
jgi:large subunit ribosomal protein L9